MKNDIATLAEENKAERYHIYIFKNKNEDDKPAFLFYAQDQDEYDNCDIDAIINIEGTSYQYQDCIVSKAVTFKLVETIIGSQIISQLYIGFKSLVDNTKWYGQLVNDLNLIKRI